MSTVARVALLVCLGLLAACTQQHPAPPSSPPSAVPTRIPAYDGSLPPAQAVLALVPLDVTTVRLVDLAEIRRQVGLPELTSRSSAADRAAFWRRAAARAPLLDRPVLAGVDARLRASYGFGVDDVEWEAHLSGGGRRGWVLGFSPGVDPVSVRRAVQAGIGPLRGAHVDAADGLVTRDAAAPGEPVWGSDPAWARLVPARGEAFVLQRGCLERPSLRTAAPLDPIAGFAVTFGDHVATVRVDRDRTDLFARARLGGARFGRVFRHGVADPSTGRIGYDVPRPARAAALARHGDLPFGVCVPGD